MPPPASESRTQFHHLHHLLHHHHLIICQRVQHRHHSPTPFLPILSVRTWDKCGNLPLSSLQIISLQLGFSSRLLWDLSVSQNAPRRKLIDALSTIKEKTFSYQKKKLSPIKRKNSLLSLLLLQLLFSLPRSCCSSPRKIPLHTSCIAHTFVHTDQNQFNALLYHAFSAEYCRAMFFLWKKDLEPVDSQILFRILCSAPPCQEKSFS